MKSQPLLRTLVVARPHDSGVAERHWAARDPSPVTSVTTQYNFASISYQTAFNDGTGGLYGKVPGDTEIWQVIV